MPSEVLVFLGLEINTVDMTVRIHSDKLCRLKAIPPARAFNRRFYDAMSGLSKPIHRIRINNEMKEDINVWLMFLYLYNGISCHDVSQWLSYHDLHLFTESVGNAQLGRPAIWYLYLWLLIYGPTNCITKKILHTDNLALVSLLNKNSSKSKRVMQFIRPLVLQSMIYNIQFKPVHIDDK
ncbi:hypothetical protein KUTeg_012103 [Tegillarca granosa]|uniref:BTB domain-containing protein n=1 Tax=Tegillarca granosa TaxID=220873 RepID=A0ABQ9EYK6_TEGGR|nr:hypothetical protein KUTeg_012103 [Tegillarca granosa]